jgi:nitrogen fixation/metabolism regulation signal transduction histidine kinase
MEQSGKGMGFGLAAAKAGMNEKTAQIDLR